MVKVQHRTVERQTSAGGSYRFPNENRRFDTGGLRPTTWGTTQVDITDVYVDDVFAATFDGTLTVEQVETLLCERKTREQEARFRRTAEEEKEVAAMKKYAAWKQQLPHELLALYEEQTMSHDTYLPYRRRAAAVAIDVYQSQGGTMPKLEGEESCGGNYFAVQDALAN